MRYVWREPSTSYTSEEYDSFLGAKSAAESANQDKTTTIEIWSLTDDGDGDDVLERLEFH